MGVPLTLPQPDDAQNRTFSPGQVALDPSAMIDPQAITGSMGAGPMPPVIPQAHQPGAMNGLQAALALASRMAMPASQYQHNVDLQTQFGAQKAQLLMQAMRAKAAQAMQQAELGERTQHDRAIEGVESENAATNKQRATQEGQYQQGELGIGKERAATEQKQEQNAEKAELERERADLANEGLKKDEINATLAMRKAQMEMTAQFRGAMLNERMGGDAQKIYQPAMDADSRLQVMRQNLEDGLKGNQQAQLSLVANHIGMTLGLQHGARITRAAWEEAEQSAPWLQRVKARFDKDGFLSGVVLSPEQMHQMVGLAEQRDQIAWQQASSQAKARGLTGYAPESTVNGGGGGNFTHTWTPDGGLQPTGAQQQH